MKFKPVPMRILAAALFAGYQVWKRQQTTTEGEAATSVGQSFADLFGKLFGNVAEAAPPPPAAPAPAPTTAADNGTAAAPAPPASAFIENPSTY